MMHPNEKTYFEKHRQDFIALPAFDLAENPPEITGKAGHQVSTK
jgi:hypothetical protein